MEQFSAKNIPGLQLDPDGKRYDLKQMQLRIKEITRQYTPSRGD
jgi:hypothetical protein